MGVTILLKLHSDTCFIRNFRNSEVFYSVEISRTSSLRITEHSNEYFKTDGNLKFATPWYLLLNNHLISIAFFLYCFSFSINKIYEN